MLQVDGALTVQSNASVICAGLNTGGQVSGQWAGVGVSIQAGTVTVAAGGTISADGQGYIGGQGPGAGTDSPSWLGGGGGYGGNGADSTVGASGGGAYGSVLLPSDLGSGSGNGAWGLGGSGGGAIELSVAQTLTLNGTITADGLSSSGPSDEVSGGSGGSTAHPPELTDLISKEDISRRRLMDRNLTLESHGSRIFRLTPLK